MKQKRNRNNFFTNFWNGNISLGISFWVIYFIGGTLISLPANVIFIETDPYYWLTFLIFIIYMLWSIVGTWKSASKFKPKKNQWSWGTIAKIYIVLSILRMFAVLFTSL